MVYWSEELSHLSYNSRVVKKLSLGVVNMLEYYDLMLWPRCITNEIWSKSKSGGNRTVSLIFSCS